MLTIFTLITDLPPVFVAAAVGVPCFEQWHCDDPKAILKRMGGGQLNLETGNWLSVSSSAKVTNMTLTKDLLTSYFTKRKRMNELLVNYTYIVVDVLQCIDVPTGLGSFDARRGALETSDVIGNPPASLDDVPKPSKDPIGGWCKGARRQGM